MYRCLLPGLTFQCLRGEADYNNTTNGLKQSCNRSPFFSPLVTDKFALSISCPADPLFSWKEKSGAGFISRRINPHSLYLTDCANTFLSETKKNPAVCVSVYLSVCLSVCLYLCLSLCLSLSLSFSFCL